MEFGVHNRRQQQKGCNHSTEQQMQSDNAAWSI